LTLKPLKFNQRPWNLGASVESADIACKFCGSTRLRKLDIYPGGQRYRCRNCRHTFTDNKALPGMKIDKAIVSRFIDLRTQSKTLSQISDIIQAEYKVRLACGTLSRWQQRFSSTSTTRDKHWRRSLIELVEIAEKKKGQTIPEGEIKSIFGYSQTTKIQDTQLFTAGIIVKNGKGWLIKS
jgi:transposase-like protein